MYRWKKAYILNLKQRRRLLLFTTIIRISQLLKHYTPYVVNLLTSNTYNRTLYMEVNNQSTGNETQSPPLFGNYLHSVLNLDGIPSQFQTSRSRPDLMLQLIIIRHWNENRPVSGFTIVVELVQILFRFRRRSLRKSVLFRGLLHFWKAKSRLQVVEFFLKSNLYCGPGNGDTGFGFWLTTALSEMVVVEVLLIALYLIGIMLCRTFLSGRIKMMYNWKDEKKQK